MTTNENNCALAPFCKTAGVEGVCTEQCSAFISVMSRFKSANIPHGYTDVFLDNSPAKDNQAEIYALLDDYVKTFTKDDVRIKSLYLYSQSPGTGKSTTGSALLNEFIRRRFMYLVAKGEHIPETLGLFFDVNRMQQRYNMATMSDNKDEIATIAESVNVYGSVPFLVVDDIAVRSATESFRSIVHAIVNERVTEELPTIYTSNVPMSDLSSVFDERLADRIMDQTMQMSFSGKSKRGVR